MVCAVPQAHVLEVYVAANGAIVVLDRLIVVLVVKANVVEAHLLHLLLPLLHLLLLLLPLVVQPHRQAITIQLVVTGVVEVYSKIVI